MTTAGDIVVIVGDSERRVRQLTVRQLATMQNTLGARLASQAIRDAREAQMPSAEVLEAAAVARSQAMRTSTLMRWCFDLAGAVAILTESCGTADAADQLTEGMTPDEVTNLALQEIGFRWADGSGKWVSRSASRNGPAT